MRISGNPAVLLLAIMAFPSCALFPSKTKDISGISGALITRTVVLPHVSSGSSLVRDGQTLYLASDDAPYIYTYSLQTGQTDSIWLSYLNTREHRIAHPTKPDHEAGLLATIEGRKCLVLFGSGSQSPTRDFISLLWLDNPQKPERHNATAFYASLRKVGRIELKDFNIEGAAHTKDGNVILLNRGRQQYFLFSITDLQTWLEKGDLPAVTVQVALLPASIPYTFSGAETIDQNTLVFTASQEETQSAVTDGKVLGSAIGFLRQNRKGVWKAKALWPLKEISGKTAREKLEGIVPDPTDTEGRKFIALTDNDDGQSKLLWIELR